MKRDSPSSKDALQTDSRSNLFLYLTEKIQRAVCAFESVCVCACLLLRACVYVCERERGGRRVERA